MNTNEDYFQINKNGHIHILSDKIKLDWKELIVLPLMILLPIGFWFDWFIGFIIAFIAEIGYALYRIAASYKYSEVHIDEQSGRMLQRKMFKNKISEEHIITKHYDASNIEFRALTRSGKTKFLLVYKTEKDNDLIVFRTERDKQLVENYLKDEVTIHNATKSNE